MAADDTTGTARSCEALNKEMRLNIHFRRGSTRLLILLGWLSWLNSCGSEGRRPKWLGRRRRRGDTKMTVAALSQETCDVTGPFDEFEYSSSSQQQPQQPQNKWFSQFVDLIPDSLESLFIRFKAIVLYEPPVGIVTLFLAARLVWTGRIFQVYTSKYKSVDGVLTQEEKKTKRRHRLQVPLDMDDQAYVKFGGVERIRRQLCWSALNDILQKGNASAQVEAAVDALSVSYKPRESRYQFVEEMITPLSTLEKVLIEDESKVNKKSVKLRDMWETPKTDMEVMLHLAAKTAEIRALDALLRVTRDQLLTTSSRLFRNLKHWKRRVYIDNNLSWIFHRLMKASIEGDRLRLSYANAAFLSEVSRLGSVTQVLIERPPDMDDKALLNALAKSSKANQEAAEEENLANGQTKPAMAKRWSAKSLARAIPKVSKYSLRFNAEGRGRLSLRVYDGATNIRSDVAQNELLRNMDCNPRQWIDRAHDWTENARRVLCDVLRESVETSVSEYEQANNNLDVIDKWCTYDCGNCADLDKQWMAILNLVDNLDSLRRVGEGKELSITDSGIKVWTERLDVFGIPSSLALVGVAKVLHNYLLPYWPKFKSGARKGLTIAWDIFKSRFWKPFYGIVDGLMSKDTGLLDAFDIENEEHSLDNMLKDLNLGDGSPESRKEALQAAARLYEEQLDNGVIRSAVRGRLVRLLLIQVQQLKAGLLHAMSSIDVLVAANRLNIQILAAIPAVLIVYFGTRLIVRSIFTVRAKDIRPIKEVHAEMSDYLDELEMTFLLATPVSILPTMVESENDDGKEVVATTVTSILQPIDLGSSVLRIYRYLILLDYCGPLFPHRATSSIRHSMQELVTSYRLGTDRQVALLRLIKQKHMDLLKYL